MGERTGVPFAVEAPGRADAGRFSGKLAVVWVNQDPGDEIAEQTIDFPGIAWICPAPLKGNVAPSAKSGGPLRDPETKLRDFGFRRRNRELRRRIGCFGGRMISSRGWVGMARGRSRRRSNRMDETSMPPFNARWRGARRGLLRRARELRGGRCSSRFAGWRKRRAGSCRRIYRRRGPWWDRARREAATRG